LQGAATAAIAGLPGYLLMKRNPTLYNIITKTLDESAELFRLSYKSCREMEREMARNPDANPYQGFLQAGATDLWEQGADEGDLAADVDQSIKDSPPTEVKWLGGNAYGTPDNPVQINRDIVVAGYNILIGRIGDVSVTDAPATAEELSQPVVKIWPDPEQAARWAQDVLGDKIIVLGKDAPAPETIAGKGLRPKVEELEPLVAAALALALETDDYTDLNKFTSARISGLLIESLRDMPRGDAAVMTDRLVSEMAVSEAAERLTLIKQMMLIGLKAPDVGASTGGATAEEYIRGVTFPDMEVAQNEIYDALELKQRTINRTTVSILNHAEQLRNSAAGAEPGQIKTTDSALGGAVPQ
jgi:integrating conjugative element protein (TIGR03755 family)